VEFCCGRVWHNFVMPEPTVDDDNSGISEPISPVPAVNLNPNLVIINNSKRKCGVCGVAGHDKQNCPADNTQGEFLLMLLMMHFETP
jgi:hypothetical protein